MTGRRRWKSRWLVRKWFARSLLILVSSLASSTAVPQEAAPVLKGRFKTRIYGVGEGLPSANIRAMAQDAAGRIWVLTQAGLAYYDGRSWIRPPLDGLPEAQLGVLAIDPEDQVWTATQLYGPEVYRFDGTSWHRLPDVPNPREHFRAGIVAIAIVPAGDSFRVAVGSVGSGMWLWDGRSWSHFRGMEAAGTLPAGTLPSNSVYALTALGERLAVGTSQGLCFVEGTTLDCSIRRTDPRLRQRIIHAGSDPRHPRRLWLFSARWLGYLEDGALTEVASGFSFERFFDRAVAALQVDSAGGVYFGSPAAVLFYDPDQGRVQAMDENTGLASRGSTALLLDRESKLWVGGTRGLTRIESRRFLSLDHLHGLLEDEVTALVEQRSGAMVVAHNSGLTLLDGDRVQTIRLATPPKEYPDAFRIMDMALDDDGAVWIAAHTKGLLRLVGDRLEAVLPNVKVGAVEIDGSGRLWIAAESQVLVRRDGAFVPIGSGIDIHYARWLMARPGGEMYVATNRGLVWHDAAGWHRALGAKNEADVIYGMFAVPSGEIWVGTLAGLHRLRGNRLIPVKEGELEIKNPIYFIFEDPRGRYWFGTDDGVRIWDGEKLRYLSIQHGLAGRETNRGAGFVDRGGRVWIGTDRGVSIYQERYDTEIAVAPRVLLRFVGVGVDEYPLDLPIELGYEQNTLTFHVHAVAFSDERDVVYRYRLEGFEATWQGPAGALPSGLRYTNVPPGEYRLHVAAGWADDGPWSPEEVSATIVIRKPFWQEPSFLALSFILGIAALVAGYRLRVRAIKRRNQELESLNTRLERYLDERETLISQLEARNTDLERFHYTLSHDLKTPLFTLRGFAGQLRKDMEHGHRERMERDLFFIEDAAGKMGRLLSGLLELSRLRHRIRTCEEVDFGELARQAVEEASPELQRRSITVSIDEHLPIIMGDRMRLAEVLRNLVDNAVKYMGEREQRHIEIGRGPEDAEDPCVRFFVRDNGIGIDSRYQEKVFGLFERLDSEEPGTGIGLALTKRIVESHGGEIWVESEGLGRGTTVWVTLSPGGDRAPRADGSG